MKVRSAWRQITMMALVCVVALPSAGSGDPIIVGLPADEDTGNCYPFACGYTGLYQQVYTSSLFSGPIVINGLEFYNTEFQGHATSIPSGTWTISLSTSSADWNTLNSTFAANIGIDDTQVFTGNPARPWSFGDTLAIPFSTPFTYDPASGNLLMTVVASNNPAGADLFFDTNGVNDFRYNGNTIMGRVYEFGGARVVDSGYGLVTGFQADPVPEPTSLLLLGTGLAIVGVRRWPHR